MCYYLVLFWLYIIMTTSLQFVDFKQVCFSLICNICYVSVFLHDLYSLLNYYLKCVYKKESRVDIYNWFWKYCQMKMYHLEGECEILSQLMKRSTFVYCQVRINQLQVRKLITLNLNGLRDNRKRVLVFNWFVLKKYDCICLQERHCTGLILTGGNINGKHKGVVLVHGYVDLVNRGAWLSFKINILLVKLILAFLIRMVDY